MTTSPMEDEDLTRLEDFLLSDQTPETTMPLDMLEGFFAAVLSSPDEIDSAEWLPQVWGNEETPKYHSNDEEEEIKRLLLAFHRDVADQLSNEATFMPIWDGLDGEELKISFNIWCLGYVKGMELDVESWATIDNDSDTHAYLVPIMLGAMDPDQPPEEFAEILGNDEQLQVLRSAIPEATCVLYDYWQESHFLAEDEF